MIIFRQTPTESEQTFLNEAIYWVQLQQHPGWTLALQYLDGLVAEAQNTIDSTLSSDPHITHVLHLRRLMRKSTVDALRDRMKDICDRYAALTEDLSKPTQEEESYEHPGDYSDPTEPDTCPV